ncbi:hypothetical protein PISMIDRAFT_682328 [Pisolithus microcarpus 441]|uniref:MARVEL domain-containing protein n=1 Tax=Pisolithus microcarpus 441 TaxID=765257 RepID=A0A0C9Y6T5_9AGAM|nr:hypothetical protein PISMIDRAFT_682328 [Pisolithus microcarpus 441]
MFLVPNTSFAAFGLVTACLTATSLPLFFILDRTRRGVFTSTVVFEIVWFLVLGVLWVATAWDTIVGRTNIIDGCELNLYPDPTCYWAVVLEISAFVIFFVVFFYYDVLFLYAIVSAIRGRGIWTMSVRDAANGGPRNPAIVIMQPPYPLQVVPQYPGFQNVPQYSGIPQPQYSSIPQQQYSGIPQQQYSGIPQQQYSGIPQPQYSGIPQQQHPGLPQQQYATIPQQQYSGIPQQQYSGIPQQQYHPGAPQQQYPGVPQVDNSSPVQSNYAPPMGNSPHSPEHNQANAGSYLPQGQV